MGITAEKVAAQWKVSREAQDAFSLESHLRALKAQAAGEFSDEMTPIDVIARFPNLATGETHDARAPSASTKARARTPRSRASPS
jgi:acetyl-CoA acyltransferase